MLCFCYAKGFRAFHHLEIASHQAAGLGILPVYSFYIAGVSLMLRKTIKLRWIIYEQYVPYWLQKQGGRDLSEIRGNSELISWRSDVFLDTTSTISAKEHAKQHVTQTTLPVADTHATIQELLYIKASPVLLSIHNGPSIDRRARAKNEFCYIDTAYNLFSRCTRNGPSYRKISSDLAYDHCINL